MFKSTLNSTLNHLALNQVKPAALLTSKLDLINQKSVRYARDIKPWINGPIELWKKKIYNYEYRKGRARKVLKIELPDFEKMRHEKSDTKMSMDEIRSTLKERGLVPNRNWLEKPIYVGDSGMVLDQYIPPEGDGKASIISKKGVVQKVDSADQIRKMHLASRKIRKYLGNFDAQNWALNESLGIYIKVHEKLCEGNQEALYPLVTDFCLPKLLFNAELKTIKWKYIKTIELPRAVNVRVQDQEGLCFGQVTVRFHSQQMLAIYDKFGRLVNGSEVILKDVLDYIVFENRVSSVYGVWRIHDKILPEWDQTKELYSETSIKSIERRVEE